MHQPCQMPVFSGPVLSHGISDLRSLKPNIARASSDVRGIRPIERGIWRSPHAHRCAQPCLANRCRYGKTVQRNLTDRFMDRRHQEAPAEPRPRTAVSNHCLRTLYLLGDRAGLAIFALDTEPSELCATWWQVKVQVPVLRL